MTDDLNAGEVALLCLLSLLRGAFKDLTKKFGEIDRRAAKRALDTIEATIAIELSRISTKGFQSAKIDDSSLNDIALELRDMIKFAREALKNRMH
jgi:hypothetical protein